MDTEKVLKKPEKQLGVFLSEHDFQLVLEALSIAEAVLRKQHETLVKTFGTYNNPNLEGERSHAEAYYDKAIEMHKLNESLYKLENNDNEKI
jgi:hypothetical protein